MFEEMTKLFDEFTAETDKFIQKQNKQKLRDVVTNILQNDEKARENDNYLIYKTFTVMGWPMTLEEIAEGSTINRFESISRIRRKIQETNPMLMPNEKVTARRAELEEEYRTEMRGL